MRKGILVIYFENEQIHLGKEQIYLKHEIILLGHMSLDTPFKQTHVKMYFT